MGDVGITQLQFNIGNQLLALGIVLLEVCRLCQKKYWREEYVLTW
jgi:hypothetical protein